MRFSQRAAAAVEFKLNEPCQGGTGGMPAGSWVRSLPSKQVPARGAHLGPKPIPGALPVSLPLILSQLSERDTAFASGSLRRSPRSGEAETGAQAGPAPEPGPSH